MSYSNRARFECNFISIPEDRHGGPEFVRNGAMVVESRILFLLFARYPT